MTRSPCRLHRAALATAIVLVVCVPPAAAQDANDPLEPVNRAVFQFNQVVDGMFLEPAAIMYRNGVPPFFRDRIRNFLANLREPITFVNQTLQGDGHAALDTFGRFMTNTLLGGAGLFDVASEAGLTRPPREDFGQTLGAWGVGEGPFLMLPILGPSNPRDLSGLLVDSLVIDPVPNFTGSALTDVELTNPVLGRVVLETVDFREQNLETFRAIEETSVDLYATVRSAYRQRRAALIAGGAADAPESDLYEDPLAEPE